MLRLFKVPVGLNEDERQIIIDFFDDKEVERKKKWFSSWRGKKFKGFDPNEGMLNDHSRVFYLMGPTNRFIAFYKLDLNERDLESLIMEDISTDIGYRYVGTGKTPMNRE